MANRLSMKYIFSVRVVMFYFLLVISQSVEAQSNFDIEKVEFEIRDRWENFIPKLVALNSEDETQDVVNQVNKELLDFYGLTSFEPSQITAETYLCSSDFSWRFDSGILEISVQLARGMKCGDVDGELYFDLNNGGLKLSQEDIPLHTLFTSTGYFEFMEKYWIDNVKYAFDMEALSYYRAEGEDGGYRALKRDLYEEIGWYTVDTGYFNCHSYFTPYPESLRCYNPVAESTVPIYSVIPYLSDFGKKVLLQDDYTAMEGIERLLYERRMASQIPKRVVVYGAIDNKYEFAMSLDINRISAEGQYWYLSKKQNIKLLGALSPNYFYLEEYTNGMNTGIFVFNVGEEYESEAFGLYGENESRYVEGYWQKSVGSTHLPIFIYSVQQFGWQNIR